MADNLYSQLTAELVTALSALSSTYSGLSVIRRRWQPTDLPDFTRYCIVVAPSLNPWDERRNSQGEIQYIMRVDLYLLVKNWNEDASIWGVTAGSLGLFQLVEDVKVLIRGEDLGGLMPRSIKAYDEVSSPVQFEWGAVMAFDSGEKAFVHRAKLLFQAGMLPFCYPRI